MVIRANSKSRYSFTLFLAFYPFRCTAYPETSRTQLTTYIPAFWLKATASISMSVSSGTVGKGEVNRTLDLSASSLLATRMTYVYRLGRKCVKALERESSARRDDEVQRASLCSWICFDHEH